MFICSCTQDRLLSLEYMPALDNVRKDHSIQMADMGGGIDIEYRRGDVVRLLGRCLGGNGPSVAVATNLTRRANPRWSPQQTGKYSPECRGCCVRNWDVHASVVSSLFATILAWTSSTTLFRGSVALNR